MARPESIVTTIPPLTIMSTSCFAWPTIAAHNPSTTATQTMNASSIRIFIRSSPTLERVPHFSRVLCARSGDFTSSSSSHSLQIKSKEVLRIRIQTNLRIHRPRLLAREPFLIHPNIQSLHRTQLRPQHKRDRHGIK